MVNEPFEFKNFILDRVHTVPALKCVLCRLQDGEQTEVTKQYKVVYEDTEAFMKKLVSRVRRRKKKDDGDEDD